ncbi:MAG TPA: hypothetical protein VE964_11685 [Myxococcales bacterium]|nr:hypothetical protein [Myxococcales bacterium]
MLDAAAVRLMAVSPDGQTLLVSHQISGRGLNGGDGDMVLVTTGAPPRTLVADTDVQWVQFSPDGRTFAFVRAPYERIQFANAADGSVIDGVTVPNGCCIQPFYGRFIYWTALVGGRWRALRIVPPDGQPEVLASGAAPAPATPDVAVVPSAGGEAYFTSDGSGIARLALPHASAVVPKSVLPITFSPDQSWAISSFGVLYDPQARPHSVAQVSAPYPAPPVFSSDSSHVTLQADDGVRVIDLASLSIAILPAPAPLPPGAVPSAALGLTADGSRVIATTWPFRQPATVEWANSAGGAWEVLSTDVAERNVETATGPASTPDGRVIAANSLHLGPVLSVDGRAPMAVTMDGGSLLAATPIFEPAGGRNRAVFCASNDYAHGRVFVMGNADGSGDWTPMPHSGSYPQWMGRNVYTFEDRGLNARRQAVYDLYVTPDDGPQSLVVQEIVGANMVDVQGRTMVDYVTGGGLYTAPVPQAAP